MIAKIVSLISSLLVGTSMMFASAEKPAQAQTQAQVQPAVYRQAQMSPTTPVTTASGRSDSEGLAVRIQELLGKRVFQGDRLVRQGLILATVSVTGQTPVDVLQALQEGQSIANIAQSAGKTSRDVLGVYNQTVEYLIQQAVQRRPALTGSLELRTNWYEQAGALEVEQPGMAPAFPSLPELRAAATLATLKISAVDRSQMRLDLRDGSSLNDILVRSGHTSQEAVTAAMGRIDIRLNNLVDNDKLGDVQRHAWSTSISDLLIQIIDTLVGIPANSGSASNSPGV